MLLILSLLLSAASQAKTVALLGQWHLTAKTLTHNISEGKKLPQFSNQKAIYLVLDEWIRGGKISLLIAEGCEGEIDKGFRQSFNGWDYAKLDKRKNNSEYEDILSLVPLKIEVKHKKKIRTVCGDDLSLIKAHQRVFSDLTGFVGFYERLKPSHKKNKAFNAYKVALEELEKKKIKEPITYLKKRIRTLFDKEKELIEKRNKSFVELVKRSNDEVMAIVIGNRHLKGLEKDLKKIGIKVLRPSLIEETLPKTNFEKLILNEV